MELLILLTLLLTIIAVAKVLKAKELVDEFKNVESDPISDAEIKTNALGMLVWGILFFAIVIWTLIAWDKYLLPSSASFHGDDIDLLFKITMILIFVTFFITHALLFWFVYKYYYKKGKKALWFPHDNKLEMAWTVVPAAVLILLVTYGMSTWGKVMYQEPTKDAVRVEILSEQFKWTTRYAGSDRVLGEVSFSLYGKNSMGIATKIAMEDRLKECYESVEKLRIDSNYVDSLVKKGWNREDGLDEVKDGLKNYRSNINRIKKMLEEYKVSPLLFDAGNDDKVINSDTIYFPKGKQVILQLRSKDVIHSAYLPHFRVQMNTVPGMKTSFTFVPKYTSKEMKEVAAKEGKQFTGYILLCNKICGASHYNMKLFVKVVEPSVYQKWLATQKTFKESYQ